MYNIINNDNDVVRWWQDMSIYRYVDVLLWESNFHNMELNSFNKYIKLLKGANYQINHIFHF